MIRFWKERFKRSTVTENPRFEEEIREIHRQISDEITRHFAGSLAIRMVDSGSCNACEAECNALSNPYYDLERLGIRFVASPRHADVMLVSGVLSFNMLPHVLDAWEQIPAPKWLLALGDCPAMDAPFLPSFAIKAPLSEHLPVDFHIPGCPPSPEEIMRGLLDFLRTL